MTPCSLYQCTRRFTDDDAELLGLIEQLHDDSQVGTQPQAATQAASLPAAATQVSWFFVPDLGILCIYLLRLHMHGGEPYARASSQSPLVVG